jgi:predicted XRE-type DNA-binding protein
MDASTGIVVFGDVIGSRNGPAVATGWLGTLRRRLDSIYGKRRLAPFEFTQGDEIQGLLHPAADPLLAILESTLLPHDGHDAAPWMRWVAVFGAVDPGRGPATHRTGDAFLRARALLQQARDDHDGLLCQTGDAATDAVLAGTAPVMAAIIDRMTDRQRQIARLALVDGLRQSEIADRLGVARPTVSVSSARADVRSLARLTGAVRLVWTDGVDRVTARTA